MYSIIIPNFNNVRFVGEATRSVIAQTDPGWELVVVDDASEDEAV